MTAKDFFLISAGLNIWIVTLILLFVFYKIIRLIIKIELEATTIIKNTFKLTGLKLLAKLLGLVKGGEKNDIE